MRGEGGVRLKAEGWYGEITVDGSGQIEEVTLEMRRDKLALELTQGLSLLVKLEPLPEIKEVTITIHTC